MKKLFVFTFLLLFFAVFLSKAVFARDFGLGVHVLHPDEINQIIKFRGDSEKYYVTVPLSLSDRRSEVWNDFFDKAKKNKITPIIRLTSSFNHGSGYWEVPSKKEVVESVLFISELEWGSPRIVVLFNEPNHAAEWGGIVDPDSYADLAMFAASWLHTEKKSYLVLPAGLDNAAPNSKFSMDSLLFWDKVFKRQPDLVNWINGWASHSYPNPGFSASPYTKGKQSLRGFEEELAFLRKYSKNDLPVYITETGWKDSRYITPNLISFYSYAMKNIWSNPQVKAVTVFLFQGSPGPFSAFSLLTPEGTPTPQFDAFRLLEKSLIAE
ncbi:hypothetical protein ACFL1M_01545 [Patescibacteria group bacterium]